MKTTTVILVILAALLAVPSCAGVPPIINYQGKLMQPSGAPVADGTYSVQFAIYAAPTGGTALWSETNTGVQVKGGLFAVLLGSVNNLGANIFDQPNRFFGVKVGSDPEMTPRQQIASVAFAVKAASADLATSVPDASITTAKVATAAITTDRLAPGAVTTDRIAVGTVTADRLAPGVAIPPGTILMWSGAVNQIPQGWALCDGTNGTPNLKNRFIVGAGDEYAVGAWGGEKLHTLTVAEMPSHNHTWSAWRQLAGVDDNDNGTEMSKGDRGTIDLFSKTTDSKGGGQPHENRPPYYALCFIMKMGY